MIDGVIVFDTPAREPGQKSVLGLKTAPMETVRVGFVGLGMRGPGAVERFTHLDGVEIKALCDLYPERVDSAQAILARRGFPEAAAYSGEEGWKQLCERGDIDLVYIVCAVPFISAVLVAGGRAAEVATGGAVSSQTFTLICGIIMTVFVMLGGVKSTALADAVQGWFFILALWAIIFVTLKVVFNGSLIEAFQTVRVQTPDWFSYPGPIGICTYPSRVSYPLACAFGYTLLLPQVFVRSGYYSAGLKDQRQMAFLAPFLQIIVWGGTMLIGLVALAAMPDLTSSETELVIPYMCNIIAGTHGVLAQILMIVFLIGVLAVGLSTANALLMVMSSIIYKDLLVGIGHCKFKASETSVVRVVILLFGAVTVGVSLMHWEYVYNLMIFADSLVESLFPALVFGIYCKWATRKAAIVSISAGAIVICLTFFVWDLGYVWYGTIGLVTALVLMYVVSKLTRDDPKDSDDFYEALDSGHRRFMRIKAKIR